MEPLKENKKSRFTRLKFSYLFRSSIDTLLYTTVQFTFSFAFIPGLRKVLVNFSTKKGPSFPVVYVVPFVREYFQFVYISQFGTNENASKLMFAKRINSFTRKENKIQTKIKTDKSAIVKVSMETDIH